MTDLMKCYLELITNKKFYDTSDKCDLCYVNDTFRYNLDNIISVKKTSLDNRFIVDEIELLNNENTREEIKSLVAILDRNKSMQITNDTISKFTYCDHEYDIHFNDMNKIKWMILFMNNNPDVFGVIVKA